MAQPYLDKLEALVGKHCAGAQDLTCKHFFSGAALYCNARMCASLGPKGLAFKLELARSAAVIARGEAEPLRYFEKSPVKKGYILLPNFARLKAGELQAYFEECLAYANHSRD
jgi:hypothetical protein